LRETLAILSLEPKVKTEVQTIVEQFAFALTFHRKFEDLWNRMYITHSGVSVDKTDGVGVIK
jgi:hypothetical protein